MSTPREPRVGFLHRLSAAAAALVLVALGGLAGATTAATPAWAQGPEAGPGQWYISEYGIDEMWKSTTGRGVSVAVIDSGIDSGHENLTGRVAKAEDFSETGKDGTTPIGDSSIIHHGTAVAGVIAGNGTGVGPMGVAPDAKLISASMWLGSNRPKSSPPSRQQAAAALRWAVDQGADVVNMSLGWDDPTWQPDWDDAFSYAFSKDVVVIACVGNRSQGARRAWSPSTVPGVVGVGGLRKSGTVREESSAPGIAVDLMGPAEQIPVPLPGGAYGTGSGCSFAAPVVSGVAALIRSRHPKLSADEVVAKLYATASPVPGHDGTSTPERPDPIVGHGRIQPRAALDAAVPGTVPHASRELSDWIAMHRRAEPTPTDEKRQPHSDKEPSADGDVEVTATTTSAVGPIFLTAGGAVAAGLLAAGIVRMRRDRRTDADQDGSAGADSAPETADSPAADTAPEAVETPVESTPDRPAEQGK